MFSQYAWQLITRMVYFKMNKAYDKIKMTKHLMIVLLQIVYGYRRKNQEQVTLHNSTTSVNLHSACPVCNVNCIISQWSCDNVNDKADVQFFLEILKHKAVMDCCIYIL